MISPIAFLGDIQVKLTLDSRSRLQYAYQKFNTALHLIGKLKTELMAYVTWRREEFTKEEITFMSTILASLRAAEADVEAVKAILGGILGVERPPGRRGRPGKIVIGIRDLSVLVRVFTAASTFEKLDELRSQLIRVFAPSEDRVPETVRSVDNKLGNIIGVVGAGLKITKELVEDILERIRDQCECKIVS